MSEPESKEENERQLSEEESKEPLPEETEAEQGTEEETGEEAEEEAAEAPSAPEAEEAPGEEEIEVVEEKIYTIPLRHAWVVTPRGKRAPRAVRDVRSYVARHMKADEVAVSNEINSAIWARSINKPPRKVTVRAVKDKEGKVVIYPAKSA